MEPLNDHRYGIKFSEANPPPGYRGAEIETIRQALARLRTILLSRIPARGITAVAILTNQSVHTPGDLTIRLSSLIALRRVPDNKAIINVTAPIDQEGMVTTSHVFDNEGQGGIFPPNIPLALLAPGQRLHLEIYFSIGDTQTHLTGFSPVTVCNFYQTEGGGYQFEFELVTGIDGSNGAKDIYEMAAKIASEISKEL